LPKLVALAAGTCQFAAQLAEHLVVDPERMRANVDATHGILLAESASMALRSHLGSEVAKRIVRAACQTATRERRHLIDVLREQSQAAVDWAALRDEANYLGSINAFIDSVLAEAAAVIPTAK